MRGASVKDRAESRKVKMKNMTSACVILLFSAIIFAASSRESILSLDKNSPSFLKENTKIRNKINKAILGQGKQEWKAHDAPEDLFPPRTQLEKNIRNLKQEASLSSRPWSAFYWPIASGGVSARYGSREFNSLIEKHLDDIDVGEDEQSILGYNHTVLTSFYQQPGDFLRLSRYIQPVRDLYIASRYSPAEKYDLLVQDKNFSMTNFYKQEGMLYADDKGLVEVWMGICHGWAAAAIAEPRISKHVEVLAVDGKTKVNFHYDDLRALLSLKYAKSSFKSRFIGGRCDIADKDIEKDEYGRVMNSECLDTNPGTWHIVVGNMIGVHDRSFIMDATFDLEVWNQPVYGYRAKYFNVITGKIGTLEESIALVDEALRTKDPFAKYRSPKTKSIVGVVMEVTYVDETLPYPAHPHKDKLSTVEYLYDLEIDAQGNIIGGEWHENNHPDFLWTVEGKPKNGIDRQIDKHFNALLADIKKDKNILHTLNKEVGGDLKGLAKLSMELDDSPLYLVLEALHLLAE